MQDDQKIRAALEAQGLSAEVIEAMLAGGRAHLASAGDRSVAVGGNVFGNVNVGAADPAAVDEATLRSHYLARLAEKADLLSLAGVDPAAASGDPAACLNLQAVYTALLTLSPEEDEGLRGAKVPKLEGPKGDRLRISALEHLNRQLRLVLLGDPGSGKSTFVNFVALCLAGEALEIPGVGLERLRVPLPEDKKPQPWNHGALLPVRVVLRDFAARGLPDSGERGTAEHLWHFIESDLVEASLAAYAPFLKKALLKNGGLILLDGLDEVPEAESRRERICQSVESFVQAFQRCRFLLTSRTYAYRNQGWRLPGFSEAVLAPFSPAQIRLFVSRWYDHVASLGRLSGGDAAGRAELLQRAIFGSDRLLALAERPLLLTLMASLHAWRGGTLPERREQLYSDAVDLLLNTWESQRVIRKPNGEVVLIQRSLAEWLKVDREEVRKALDELAYEAHAAQPDLAGTADVDGNKLVLRLVRLSRDRGADPDELVRHLNQRAGLLVARGEGIYTFPHRTFQEYLAACHLTGETFPDLLADLVRKEPDRWREAALLAGAKAARGTASSVWQLADCLCFREPEDPKAGLEDVWGAQLAGQVLAESADLAKAGEANLPKLERVRRWLLHLLRLEGFPATERVLAGRTLALLGDPRFDPKLAYLPKESLLGFVEVPAGPFWMGSKRESARGDEFPQHAVLLPTFYMARYPVTVAQCRAFVEATSYPASPESLEGSAHQPVGEVTWNDALAYCEWLDGRLREEATKRLKDPEGERERSLWESLAAGRLKVTLPSEAEWEKAARGEDGRIYPWGNECDSDRANYIDTRILGRSPVGCFPMGASPYGCEEMAGNVWEWTRSLDGDYPYPPPGSEREKREFLSNPGLRVMRGGACGDDSARVRSAVRYREDPLDRYRLNGFRVVLLHSPLISDPSGL